MIIDRFASKSNTDIQGYDQHIHSQIQHRFPGSGLWLIHPLQNPTPVSRVSWEWVMTDTSTPISSTDFRGVGYDWYIHSKIQHIFPGNGLYDRNTDPRNQTHFQGLGCGWDNHAQIQHIFCEFDHDWDVLSSNPTHSQGVVYDGDTHLHIEQSVTETGGLSALSYSPPHGTKRHRDRGYECLELLNSTWNKTSPRQGVWVPWVTHLHIEQSVTETGGGVPWATHIQIQQTFQAIAYGESSGRS